MLCNPNEYPDPDETYNEFDDAKDSEPADLRVKSWVVYFIRNDRYVFFTFPDQETAIECVPWVALIEGVDLNEIQVDPSLNEYNKETRR